VGNDAKIQQLSSSS